MEAPEPIKPGINTPKIILDTKNINFIEELKINQEKENYILQLGKENENILIIKVISENLKDICYFQNHYDLNELKNLSEVFTFYQSIDIIISFLKTLKYKIIENDENIIIKFDLFMPNGQTKLIELNLKKLLLDSNHMINYLLKENKRLREIVNKNTDEISNLYAIISELNTTIFRLDNKISELAKSLYGNKSKLPKMENNNTIISKNTPQLNKNIDNYIKEDPILKDENKLVLDSKIISSIDEITFILNYIRELDKFFQFNNLKLLYRGSRDGDDTKKCHELCDNKQNILIIIHSDNDYKFGGYCKIGFENNEIMGKKRNNCRIDNNCFLFSLNLKKIYPVIKNERGICYDISFGLCFTNTLKFYNNYMHNSDSKVGYSTTRFKGFDDNPKEMNGGKINFKCIDLEVFQLQ